jgi:hypothetical protein
MMKAIEQAEDRKRENRFFRQAEGLQLKINRWVKDHGFPTT